MKRGEWRRIVLQFNKNCPFEKVKDLSFEEGVKIIKNSPDKENTDEK